MRFIYPSHPYSYPYPIPLLSISYPFPPIISLLSKGVRINEKQKITNMGIMKNIFDYQKI